MLGGRVRSHEARRGDRAGSATVGAGVRLGPALAGAVGAAVAVAVGAAVAVGLGVGLAVALALGAVVAVGVADAVGVALPLGPGDGSRADGLTSATRMLPLRSGQLEPDAAVLDPADALQRGQERGLLGHDVIGAGHPCRRERTDRRDRPVRRVRTLVRVAAGRAGDLVAAGRRR